MSNRGIRWINVGTQSHDLWDSKAGVNVASRASTQKLKNREIRWLNTTVQSHDLWDLSGKLGGFFGSNVLFAHRTKASDTILYDFFLEKAITRKSTVFIPQKEPHRIPGNFNPINIKSENIEKRRIFQEGKLYHLLIEAYETDAPKLDLLYERLLTSKKRGFPFVIIFDTLKRWTPLLEEHIRFLLRESPLVQGSIWLHCPLSNIPPDLLSVFGNVIVIWPSQHEIGLLNSHFPAEKIPIPDDTIPGHFNNRMLVFNSKPVSERGWAWHRYVADN